MGLKLSGALPDETTILMLRTACSSSTTSVTPAWRMALRVRAGPSVGLKLSGALLISFLERHNLGQGLFEEINGHLESQGLRLREGTIEAPAPTKNRAGER